MTKLLAAAALACLLAAPAAAQTPAGPTPATAMAAPRDPTQPPPAHDNSNYVATGKPLSLLPVTPYRPNKTAAREVPVRGAPPAAPAPAR